MANPQAENGHVDLANELVEALAKIRISGEEMQCLWVIIRKTYGWKKKEDWIALSQFQEMTGINHGNVCRALRGLLKKNIVVKKDDRRGVSYGIQKDYLKWRPSSKKTRGRQKRQLGVVNIDNQGSSKKTTTKDTITKDTITKERYSEFVLMTKKQCQTLNNKYGEIKTKKMIEVLNNYKGSKGKTYKSDYHAILSWVVEEVVGEIKSKESDLCPDCNQPTNGNYFGNAQRCRDCHYKKTGAVNV